MLDFDEEDLEDDEDDEDEDEDDEDEDEDEEEEEPAPKKKKSAPKDEDDEEPLISSNANPSDDEIKKAVARIIKTADLAELTKRKVIDAVKAQFPAAALDEKKQLMRETIGVEVAKRTAEEEDD